MTAAGNAEPEPVLCATDLTHVYPGPVPVTALKGVGLEVRLGDLVAVMGPSGSGKSTLLHMLGGLDTPTSGSVVIGGIDIVSLPARARARIRRRSIGYVFQDFNLVPSLNAAENVALPLQLDGLKWRKASRAAVDALESMGVGDLSDRRPARLSAGQRQRVAIARALVGPRRLLLADEPTGALDTATAQDVMTVLRQRVDGGAAAVMVTHDARMAAWADRVVFLRDGVIIDVAASANAAVALGEVP
ncbi:MAG: ABC transporter ATP-binding protein [Bifidobacteriaceae bacterium]|jgi:putative ABC transport system ATP-binding protein|nr:ABC transporter ATP-binding protein [Bifidobacteriaceae bacterium]